MFRYKGPAIQKPLWGPWGKTPPNEPTLTAVYKVRPAGRPCAAVSRVQPAPGGPLHAPGGPPQGALKAAPKPTRAPLASTTAQLVSSGTRTERRQDGLSRPVVTSSSCRQGQTRCEDR